MTTKEFHLAFNIRLDKEDIIGYPSFTPEEIDFWLTQAVIRFVKQRYSGTDAYKSDGFQTSEKRDADLRNTLQTKVVEPKKVEGTDYFVYRPEDYWFGVGEDVFITSTDRRWPKSPCDKPCERLGDMCKTCAFGKPIPKLVDPINTTYDNITTKKNDYLSEFNLNANNARPLRLSYREYIEYITDGTYDIDSVRFTYIKRPDVFNFKEWDTEYTYIPEHAHDEIVMMAVTLALESISSTDRMTTTNSLLTTQQ